MLAVVTCRRRVIVAFLSVALPVLTGSVHAYGDDPSAEACATASDNAQPLRKAGRLREATQQLLVCENMRCPSIVLDACSRELDEIDNAMPTVVFDARDATGSALTAVTVTIDGAALVDHLDGTPLSVDPGKHRFVFAVTGRKRLKEDLVIREGEKDRYEKIVLLVDDGTSSGLHTSNRTGEGRDEGHTMWPIYGAFGIGVVGLVVGIVSGGFALNTQATLNAECPTKNTCPQSGQNDIDALSRNGWISNVGFAFATIGAGVGIVLLATSANKDRSSVSVRIGPGTIGLVGVLP